MKVHWTIKKNRGNFRPCLTYTMTLESFETSLAIQAVAIKTRIPEIPRPDQSFCLPGENERCLCWEPKRFHWIQVPHFKTGDARGFIRLPYRESGQYPEVEASFRELRAAYEKKIRQIYDQPPFETRGQLDLTQKTRKLVAAKVTADRLLANFG